MTGARRGFGRAERIVDAPPPSRVVVSRLLDFFRPVILGEWHVNSEETASRTSVRDAHFISEMTADAVRFMDEP